MRLSETTHRIHVGIRLLLFAVLLGAFLVICFPTHPVSRALRSLVEPEPPVAVSGSAPIEVLFGPTSPSDPGSIETRLLGEVGAARHEILGAQYDFNLPEVSDALLRARRRGVTVRLVIEADNRSHEASRLVAAGVPVALQKETSSMHNKFFVFDRTVVWTGSANLTPRGLHDHDNNVVIVRSRAVAALFVEEFEEMAAGEFGRGSPRSDLPHEIRVDHAVVETYFAPEDGVEAQIISEIEAADRSIRFLAFSFTSRPIAEAMVARMRDSVAVSGVFERTQRMYARFDTLFDAGADVAWDGNPYLMHHKVIVIDDHTVITGSYNFSKAANEANDENCLVIHSRDVVRRYLDEFERVRSAAARQ